MFSIKYAKGLSMDKSLLIYILIGMGFFYVVTDFVAGIQEEDERYRNNDYNKAHQYDKYQGEDSVGQSILKVSELESSKQVAAWKQSPLKDEWLALFPDFSEMKLFSGDRVEGEYLKNTLTSMVDKVEDDYFSGKVSVEKAKQMLDLLK